MIENLKKHVGKLKTTGDKVVVIFRKLPTDNKSCIVIKSDKLNEYHHDRVFQLLNSKEAVSTNDFYEILDRNTFSDGTKCLQALHIQKVLEKENIDNVLMIPLTGKEVPLALINATIDNKVKEYMDQTMDSDVETSVITQTFEDTESIAKGLILQATALEDEATRKREEAYAMHPELKPTVGRPTLSAEDRAKSDEQKKVKRLERDRKNAVKAKEAKKVDAVESKVQAKLLRDAQRKDTSDAKEAK